MKGRKVMTGLNFISPKYIQNAEFETAAVDNHITKARHSKRPKVWLIAALIATMLLLMGAAIYTRWSTTAQIRYNPSEEIKKQAEQSGLSVMLEETKSAENTDEVLSVTDQGITITAVQTIVDQYTAELIFRIEGFDLPDGRIPDAQPIVTIDGEHDFYVSQSGYFFDGTTHDENGKWVYASNGQPIVFGQDGSAILDYVADDGSMEYTYNITFNPQDGRYLGKDIQVDFQYVGIQSNARAGMPERTVEGNWTLKWTLTGADTGNSLTVNPNAEIGNTGVVVLDAEIGQRTIRTRYHVNDYWDGWDELVELPQQIYGVRMKDGSVCRCGGPGSSGFEDEENMIYFIESTMYDAILDIDQVESLMFFKGWENDSNGQPTVKTFYYIPISTN